MTLRPLLGKTLRLAVPLYLSTLVLGLIPAVVMMLGLGTIAGDRPWRGDLLGPNWLGLALEILMEAYYGKGLPGLPLVIIGGGLLLPLTMLLQLLVYCFLAGGILEHLRPPPTEPEPFWVACRRWFWPFFRLSLLGSILFPMAGVVVAVITSLARSLVGPNGDTVLQLAAQAIVLGWLELARAVMVERSVRSVGRALWQAGRQVIRPVVLPVWLLLALPSGGLLLAAILPPAVSDPYAPLSLLVALVYGQGVAFLGAWTRVVRLAVAMRLERTAPVARPARVAAVRPG